MPTKEEIEAAKTDKGGWTREQLAQWGVPWPPPKGWRHKLIEESEDSGRANQIKVISMWQPWAQWVEWEWKTIESRTHARFKSLVNTRIAIARASYWDPNWYDEAKPYLTQKQIERTMQQQPIGRRPASTINCTVFVAECRELTVNDEQAALIECESIVRHGLILTDVQIVAPIPCKGSQGIWTMEWA